MKFAVLLICLCSLYGAVMSYRIGVGRADCTGPPVEIVFMGYANVAQRGQGLHLRQYSRAFITEDAGKKAVFVSVDGAMMTSPIRRDIVAKLRETYGDMYSMDNVIISSTHTHGVPGGFMMYLLYDLSIFGFVSETYRALVTGIYNSIVRAHENMVDGRLIIDETIVLDASINRSPTSYDLNPAEERALYEHNTDKELTQIRFVNNQNNEIIGAINWFAVHPTSMNNTNRLVSSDNVGYASMLLERQMSPGSLPGQGPFVGAFAASNLGDVSPNIKGPVCEYTGRECDLISKPCPDGEGLCFASGPGNNMMESTHIIATRIFQGALRIIQADGGREITGPIKYAHQFVDIPKYTTTYLNPLTREVENVRGCVAAMGDNFAGGTTDGPSFLDPSDLTDNALWLLVRDFIGEPTVDDHACHAPKPILIATGRATFPFEWQPEIVPTQLVQIGDVVISALPAEFTTMAGRRVRRAINAVSVRETGHQVKVILAGLSNLYTSYVVTPEEYNKQRYEGASTAYGPHTLTIYINQFEKLMNSMVHNEAVDAGPSPPFLDDSVLSLNPPVLYDGTPFGRRFGDVVRQPVQTYLKGSTASAVFISGNPRNNLQHEKTYFNIERLDSVGNWNVYANDADWETTFRWERTNTILGHSQIEIIWDIPSNAESGTYRIHHFGASRALFGGVSQYEGTSNQFTVTN